MAGGPEAPVTRQDGASPEGAFRLEAAAPVVKGVQGRMDLRVEGEPKTTTPQAGGGEGGRESPWKEYRILGRLREGYWVLEIPDGMVVMDPRSVHERVLFEKWMASVKKGSVPRQGLLPPAMVALSPLQSNAVRRSLGWLEAYGYGVEEFGRDAWTVQALPAWISGADPAQALSDAADWLAQNGKSPGSAPEWLPDFVAAAVGRQALRLGEALDEAAVGRLLDELSRTEMPYASPKGRPTLVLTPWRELARKFGREERR
jgi:DNA mismatch repair protein MutL